MAFALAGCGANAFLPLEASYGPAPQLPTPQPSFIPLYDVPSSAPWQPGEAPVPAPGLTVKAFARGLEHPRWLYVLPNGDVLVAESNHGPGWSDTMGFGGWVESLFQRLKGLSVKSANRITLLRDSDHDGVADQRSVFLAGLNAPFGMALVGNTFYVANTDSLMAFDYREGQTRIAGPGRKLTDLPGGDINHHWTKNLIAGPDGDSLFVAIGSNSNAGDNGMDAERQRAAIWEIDPRTGQHRIFASGLRNPVGMALADDGRLFVVVNERDQLGGDLVPDYLTSVQRGGFYGWPFSYWGTHLDPRVKPQDPALVARAIVPDYALGTHTAPLGLVASKDAGLGEGFAGGMFIAQHGSWNRKPLNGYRVIFLSFQAGKPAGQPREVLTGFLNEEEKARGRPAGLAIVKDGALLVADDGGNVIWRVAKR